ncbi:hypothetical protein GXN76_13525 [Kroppenstedtia pulmonis]|uniref:Peptidase MA-like domain-containing protein n=1 Tax=Kroppenstedtia pulmonis TaxID=1380685 RepID=A0A7D3XRQ1_9BACL|nr:hypothetical protein [Kroppenstedtia pulmonis]QKG85382.1 hypothetical protein GXN76_13525 [Kroppenstedtia pulmonis]
MAFSKKRFILWGWMILLCTLFVLPQSISAGEDTPEETIRHLVQTKQDAVNRKDRQAYLSVLNPSMPAYIQEQKRWFDDAVQWVDSGSYRLRLISLIPEKEHQLRAWLEQSYSHQGKRHTVKYPLSFQETEAGWKDSDLPFYHLTQGHTVVHYTDPDLDERASIALNAANKALGELKRKFHWSPSEKLEIKIYHQPETFRQSVKLSLPEWVGGWHEANQAVKLLGAKNDSNPRWFSSAIIHEISHQMVSDLSGDNAAYWLQEGAAEFYQDHLLPGLTTKQENPLHKPRWSWTQLEQVNLERLPQKEAKEYYDQCYQLYNFLVRQYGEGRVKQVLDTLKRDPVIDKDAVDKRKELNRRTRLAIQRVLGKTLEQLEKEWLQELERRQQEEPVFFRFNWEPEYDNSMLKWLSFPVFQFYLGGK